MFVQTVLMCVLRLMSGDALHTATASQTGDTEIFKHHTVQTQTD
jgi:hypothetical protein